MLQKQPKKPWSPSPDLYQLSDTDFPADGDLDLFDLDENSTSTFLHLDLFDFCYAEAEKELDGQVESIGEDEADALYGVSNIISIHEQCQWLNSISKGICGWHDWAQW